MKNHLFLFVLFLGLLSNSLFSQDQELRLYKTVDYMKELKSDARVNEAVSQIERDIETKLRFARQQDYILPIVFHVIVNSNESRINKEKLQKQLDILNQDFAGDARESFEYEEFMEDQRNLSQYDELKSSNSRIQFCFPDESQFNDLGIEDPINIANIASFQWENFNDLKDDKRGLAPVEPKNVINIWITDLPEGNSGYAQMPGGSPETDGIVIDYKYIQNIGEKESSYNGGHTLTHLVGNYLGLLPLWGEYRCGDDYVFDTPVHNAPNFRGTGSNHVSGCTNNPTEMVNNFMDSTDDECLSMFTNGQVHRMQILLSEEGPRAGLTELSTNCDPLERDYADEFSEEIIIDTKEAIGEVIIFPNPVKENLHITYRTEELGTYQIEIFTLSGQLKHSLSLSTSNTETEINVDTWEPGLYVLLLTDGTKEISQNFIVQ